MAKSFFEIFNDKVSLIYEYDKSTPLFVRNANTEITKNNVDIAIDILINGIHKYPDYPTAYLVLGKAYTLKGEFKDSEEAYRKGSNLIYSDTTFDFYTKEIEAFKVEKALFKSDRGAAFLANKDITMENDEPALFKNENIETDKTEIDNIEKEIGNTSNIEKEFEEKLDELANEIASSRMPEIDNSMIDNVSTKEFITEDTMIVSETLAKIYEAQSQFIEAIKVYEKLILKHPDKKEEYTNRIIDLKTSSDKQTD